MWCVIPYVLVKGHSCCLPDKQSPCLQNWATSTSSKNVFLKLSFTIDLWVFPIVELTRSAILKSQKLDSTKWRAVFIHDVYYKENHTLSRHICVEHYILLLKHLSNHIDFNTNGFRSFSLTNSTDPRQRVPLKTLDTVGNCQRAVLSLGLSHHNLHQIKHLWKLDSILVIEVAREVCVLSDA